MWEGGQSATISAKERPSSLRRLRSANFRAVSRSRSRSVRCGVRETGAENECCATWVKTRFRSSPAFTFTDSTWSEWLRGREAFRMKAETEGACEAIHFIQKSSPSSSSHALSRASWIAVGRSAGFTLKHRDKRSIAPTMSCSEIASTSAFRRKRRETWTGFTGL
jgi:hypothetical protein